MRGGAMMDARSRWRRWFCVSAVYRSWSHEGRINSPVQMQSKDAPS